MDPSTVAVAASLLARLCTGGRRVDDARLAVGLVPRLWENRQPDVEGSAVDPTTPADVAASVLGAVVGAAWVAFPGVLGDPDDAAWAAAAACARSVGLDDGASTDQLTLAAAALGLIAGAARIPRPEVDLVRAANWARYVEQHALAEWCARRALQREEDLDVRDRAAALLVLAVATHEPAVVERLYSLVPILDDGDEITRILDALRPSLIPTEPAPRSSEVGEAVMADDRQRAADLLGRNIDAMRERMPDDGMLRGLRAAYTALAAPDLDPTGYEQASRSYSDISANGSASVRVRRRRSPRSTSCSTCSRSARVRPRRRSSSRSWMAWPTRDFPNSSRSVTP